MQTFAQYALPGTIVASAVGAVVLCLVLLLYGFKSEPDDERSSAPRLLLIRFGHAVAAACFAAALMLSVVALIDQRQVQVVGPTADVQRLKSQVRSLERRLAATESRLENTGVVAAAQDVEARRPAVAPAPRARSTASAPARRAPVSDVAVSASPPARESVEASPIQPVTSQPRAVPAATTASSRDDLGERMRDDWESVKRGFREAGQDIRSGFADLGRRIKRTFD